MDLVSSSFAGLIISKRFLGFFLFVFLLVGDRSGLLGFSVCKVMSSLTRGSFISFFTVCLGEMIKCFISLCSISFGYFSDWFFLY